MDFSKVDIRRFLKASMPVRFQDISPYDFEDFVAELFLADEYEVTQTDYSGDFGADLLVEKDGLTTAIQIKRYAEDVKVSVPDINQVIAAREYYKTDDALIVTTSDFTATTIQLAKSAEVYLWDWHRLSQFISDIYFDGQDYFKFFEDDLFPEVEEEFSFNLRVRKIDNQYSETQISALLEFENVSEKNLMLHLDLPMVLTKKRKQIQASAWQEGFYHDGLLLNDSKVDVACFFSKGHIDEIRKGDRFILRVFNPEFSHPVLAEARVNSLNSDCFIVSLCYGVASREYDTLIFFREQYLSNYRLGRKMISTYYTISPSIVAWCKRTETRKHLALFCFKLIIRAIYRVIHFAGIKDIHDDKSH